MNSGVNSQFSNVRRKLFLKYLSAIKGTGENQRPWTSNWSTSSLAAASQKHPFCNLQSRARTHTVLV